MQCIFDYCYSDLRLLLCSRVTIYNNIYIEIMYSFNFYYSIIFRLSVIRGQNIHNVVLKVYCTVKTACLITRMENVQLFYEQIKHASCYNAIIIIILIAEGHHSVCLHLLWFQIVDKH